jgi:hypothetical protein
MGFGIRSALQGALKYSSHVLMTGTIIYQVYENYYDKKLNAFALPHLADESKIFPFH